MLTPKELHQLIADSHPVNVFDPLDMRVLYQNVASIALFGVLDDFSAFEGLRDSEREAARPSLHNVYRLNTQKGPATYYLDIHAEDGAVVHVFRDISELDMELVESLRGVSTDTLGQCLNRRAFMYALAHEMARTERHKSAFQLLLADIDNLLGINELHGRAGGDYVIAMVSNLIRSTIRQTDVLGRLEGDGFGLILCETSAEGGAAIGNRISRLIQSADFSFDGQDLAVTVSVGIGAYRQGDTLQSFIKRCEAALDTASHRGISQVQGG